MADFVSANYNVYKEQVTSLEEVKAVLYEGMTYEVAGIRTYNYHGRHRFALVSTTGKMLRTCHCKRI